MSSGQQRLVMTRGGHTYPAMIVTAELAVELAAAGADPWSLNRIRWPIGMAAHAFGELLITETTLRAITADNGNVVPSSVTVTMGTVGDEIDLEGMIPLNPRPIIVSGTGSVASGGSGQTRLYALPLVDARYFLNDYSQNSYNVPGPAGAGILLSTTQDGVDALWSYDQIVAQLAVDCGVTVTIDDAFGTTSYPYGYSVQGMRAALVMDQILAETGRVLVPAIDGSFTVQWVNALTVTDVLAAWDDRIIGGTASWLVGSPSGWSAACIPIAGWCRNIVPPSVKVSNPQPLAIPISGPTIEGGRNVYITTATYTASSAGVAYNSSNSPMIIQDSMPAYGTGTPPSNSTALLAKANDLATSYYRRFVAGEMIDVVIRGIVSPELGGSCQSVEWVIDGVHGSRTILNAACDNPILGFTNENPPVWSAGEAICYGTPGGPVVVHPQQRIVMGTITESDSPTPPALPASITYDGTIDGEFSFNTFTGLTPQSRPLGSTVKLYPAAADSKCLLQITDTSSGGAPTVIMLIAYGETACAGGCPA